MQGQQSIKDIVVSLAGEITWETSKSLRERLEKLAKEGRRVVINLAEVSYVDSSGLATFLSLNRRLAAQGGKLVLVNAPDRIVRALKQARISEFLQVTGKCSGCHDKIATSPLEAPRMVRTLSVPCDASRMGETRQEVTNLFEQLGLKQETVFDLTLAFGEALGNAFDHGGGAHTQGDVTVTVSLYDDRVVVEVSDSGKGCPYADGSELPEPTETRGRGIRLMAMLADGLSITPRRTGTGTSVRLVKMLDREVPSA